MKDRKPGHSECDSSATRIANAAPCAVRPQGSRAPPTARITRALFLRPARVPGVTAAAFVGLASLCAGGAWGQAPPIPALLPGGVHPAVVRVMATDRDGFSLGSGTLVAVSEHHGLVVTNWHVIRDAAGPIGVALPNGFRSTASVLKSDRDWDLAALAIWRPNVDPVPVATQPPQPGEPLTIAGYGSGQYRTITGRCTQYVAPGFNQPFEMVELSAPARQGDSGGPIFNSRGELAGVLFGTGEGKTSGSYCGRVRIFLASVKDDFFRLQPNPAMLAQAPAMNPAPSIPRPPSIAAVSARGAAPAAPGTPSAPAPVRPGQVAGIQRASPPAAIRAGDAGWTAASPAARAPAASTQNAPFLDWPVAGTTLWGDIKNYLAVVGVAAILFHALRFLVGGTFSQRGR
jgi:hypothetical protein